MIKARYRARRSIDYNTDNLLFQYEAFKNGSKNQFYYLTGSFDGFNELTIERRDELKKEAIELQEKYCKENNALCPNYYIILNKLDKDILNYKKYTPYEAIALLIETVDPNLKCLKIYMRSNDSFKTETIITEQFGFYDTELIDFEREFAKRFNKSNSSALIKKLGKKS